MSIEDMFKDMDTAQGSNSGVFFTQGNYTVELKEIEYRPNGYKGKSAHFRFKVIASNNPQHPVDSTRVWICKLDKKPDENKRTMADIKNLVFSLIGFSPKAVGTPEQNPKAHQQATQLFLGACDREYATKNSVDPTKLIGRKCELEALSIQTNPKDGKPGQFTRHVWEPTSTN
jgi:hypothetical protein